MELVKFCMDCMALPTVKTEHRMPPRTQKCSGDKGSSCPRGVPHNAIGRDPHHIFGLN